MTSVPILIGGAAGATGSSPVRSDPFAAGAGNLRTEGPRWPASCASDTGQTPAVACVAPF